MQMGTRFHSRRHMSRLWASVWLMYELADEALDAGCDLQVHFVPDGAGAFLEILDDSTQGGVFAISTVEAASLQHSLTGLSPPVATRQTLFVDGLTVDDWDRSDLVSPFL
jgi:hypothetical protein